jgi:hypothetical protein
MTTTEKWPDRRIPHTTGQIVGKRLGLIQLCVGEARAIEPRLPPLDLGIELGHGFFQELDSWGIVQTQCRPQMFLVGPREFRLDDSIVRPYKGDMVRRRQQMAHHVAPVFG